MGLICNKEGGKALKQAILHTIFLGPWTGEDPLLETKIRSVNPDGCLSKGRQEALGLRPCELTAQSTPSHPRAGRAG